jgi:4-hydroxy-2-oxoheptanedioate aldolase
MQTSGTPQAFGSVPDQAAQAVRAGCDFVVLSNDTSMLAEAARGLATAFRTELTQ